MKTKMKSKLMTAATILFASVLPLAANAATPTPLDTTGYSAIFDQLNADMTAVATGPVGIGAFAALTVGIIFRVVWSLYKKAGRAVA